MTAVERHGQAVALDRIGIMEGAEIVALDDERRIRSRLFETPGRGHRMDDRHAKSAAGGENPCGFGNGGRHAVDILQRHEGDRQIRARIVQRKGCGIREPHVHRRVGRFRRGNQRRRTVDADDVMPECLQVARETSLPAADIQRQPSRCRQQIEKLVAVKPPIAVVSGSARPFNPSPRLGLPAGTQLRRIRDGSRDRHPGLDLPLLSRPAR